MAEATQYYLEQMLPELDDFERRGIFTKDEIKSIVRNRSTLESAIHKRGPKKQDYLKYISYEVNLEQLRRKRKTRYALNVAPEAGEKGITLSDYSILKRVHALYQKCLKKHHGDEALWLQYFKWAAEVGSSKTLGHMFARAILLHPNNPTFFVLSASWEFEHNGNIDSARAIFQSGIRLNSTSKLLWFEYYKMELLYLEKIRQRKEILAVNEKLTIEERGDEEKGLKNCYKNIPEIVFKNAVKGVKGDLEFCMGFLDLSKKFPKVFKNDYAFIINTMNEEFKEDMETRFVICASFLKEESEASLPQDLVLAFEECIMAFESALTDIPTSDMWGKFLIYLMELNYTFAETCLKEIVGTVYDDALETAKSLGMYKDDLKQ